MDEILSIEEGLFTHTGKILVIVANHSRPHSGPLCWGGVFSPARPNPIPARLLRGGEGWDGGREGYVKLHDYCFATFHGLQYE